ncbi:MAG: hypothetical protein M3545_15545 [Acidobacteriota bacterium]|nr:hypothetical protein [Acidobacteriota bacterium]
MPTTGIRDEDRLIDLFLSVYEHGKWAGARSDRESPERSRDGAVDAIAKQVGTGRTLAIEHTLIEPFVGERRDFYKQFREFQRRLNEDVSLKEPGVALYIDAPVNVLPRGADWGSILDDVCAWLKAEKATFGLDASIRLCASSHHPSGSIPLSVQREHLGDSNDAVVIVQRYGEVRVPESVAKALRRKLPKLVSTDVDCRILMLERDQGFVYSSAIYEALGSVPSSGGNSIAAFVSSPTPT